MDFLSRLIGGSNNRKQPPLNTRNSPQQRLDRFKRAYNNVLQLCSRPQQLGVPGPAVEQLLESLNRLSFILKEELRIPAPYPCLAFSSTSQVYSVVGRAASACKNEKVIATTVAIFGTLIDSEMDGFITARPFARALMRFAMRVLDSGPVVVSEDTEAQLVEVLFGVAAKLRLEPDLLPVWFSGSMHRDVEENRAKDEKTFVGIAQKDDFPLCYLFIDRVHHEGRIGDFARTGLLYVFEAASNSSDLETWLVASDLPTLMASGLGALYSQLSRELSLRQNPTNLPLLLAMSDYIEMHPDSDVENVFSPEHAAHVSTFLSDLTFWQDILDHCRSPDVKQTLLDHFQILFLQQLLYPSLLQSSDTDGGSSVAVMTYLTTMLQTLTHTDLVRMILNYLLALQNKPTSTDRPPSPTVLRRQSQLFGLTTRDADEDRVEPTLFNLVDLIQTGLSSQNTQTVFAALKLYAAIVNQHRGYAIGNLIRGRMIDGQAKQRTIGALDAELKTLLGLAVNIGGIESLDDSFTGASADVRYILELQSGHEKDMPSQLQLDGVEAFPQSRPPAQFAINTLDPCFSALTLLVEKFLTNSVDVNLALTEALVGLSTCKEVDLSGWLATSPSDYQHDDSQNGIGLAHSSFAATMDEEEKAEYQAVMQSCRKQNWGRSEESVIVSTLRLVETQVDLLRKSFANFDEMLAKRKVILTGQDLTTNTKAEKLVPRALSPLPRQVTHVRQGSITGSRTTSPARSINTPRGRRMDDRDTTPIISSSSSVSSRARSVISPTRLSAQVFRPPPPDVPESPRSSSRRSSETPTKIDNEAALVKQKIRFPLDSEEDGLGLSAAVGKDTEDGTQVTLGHVLTNVVVLQNFIIELVAVMQLRASLFEDVRFD